MIRGMYYFARKCKKCGMLIWGESEDSEAEAKKDYDRKINIHYNQEHKPKARPQLAIDRIEGK